MTFWSFILLWFIVAAFVAACFGEAAKRMGSDERIDATLDHLGNGRDL